MLAEKENLEAILNSVTDGILAHDLEMTITHFNRAAEEITGFSREEAIGKRCEELFQMKLCGQDCALCQSLEHKVGLKEREVKILGKDGMPRRVLLSTAVLRDRERQIRGAIAILRDITEIASLREELKGRYGFANLVGKNHRMQEVYELIEAVADSEATVLIQGETGTGKELVARAIHYHSPRVEGPFIKVDCSALSENLLESELFGHVKGAFTGAIKDKAGRFELAHGGSIFLDEIGEISPTLQLKLLRVLQDREIERVGEARVRRVDVRVIAATNQDLREMMLQGRFREDLYYRLNVVPLFLPPLRERKEDIPLLVEHFIERFNREARKQIYGISQDALGRLLDYDWHGNIRELQNAIEHAFVKCRGRTLLPEHLPATLLQTQTEAGCRHCQGQAQAHLPTPEHQAIQEALKAAGGNRSVAARQLGMHRTTLWRKLKELG
ncbi:MAG: sigma 54-interacting transcriptional regulator [Candidatus Tectomicrobia bacterium]|uniref:Sigma 54-interacting transcriptional regulator n=1 Tax=Tectimicrobiota bacterium TaxID=2528274 RepID=A0A932CQA7_UNCTE|nr:sigma 54-interacting transcriptional regulator [Candidatus Tectomicrobia bacterium]